MAHKITNFENGLRSRYADRSIRLSYLIPYAVLAAVLLTTLALFVGWQLHDNFNKDIDNRVEQRLSLSKK